ncbi:MAG: EAL domain-containing protein [Gallionella sp.]|jgi:diguanylate cyclase (GGDEF)-like protein/PAS domain S-box-containing protein
MTHPEVLRLRAEEKTQALPAPGHLQTPEETLLHELLHELRVHQIELEMQNEELRKTLTELDTSRSLYFDFYDRAPVGYCTVNLDGEILQANLTTARLLGIERRTLLNRDFTRLILKEDQDIFYLLCKQLVEDESAKACELRMTRPDGMQFWARIDAIAVHDELGKPVHRIVLSDISALKQTEEDLRIAAISFESQEGMMVCTQNNNIIRVNQAFTKLTGYSEAEAIGKTPHLLSSGRHSKMFFQAMWSTLLATGYWQGEIWNRRKNGKIYAEWLTISQVCAPDGHVSHYVGSFSDITANEDAAAEIHRLAYYDPLTNLPNRRLLEDRLSQALATASRNRRHGAILFLDLDNFKVINDTRGHAIGDLLLIEVARRLLQLVRKGDTLARLGGDEFVLLLEDLSADTLQTSVLVEQIGEKILAELARPYLFDGYEFHCSASIGVGLYCDHEDTSDELLRHADIAMCQSKKAGRNTLRFFDPAMQAAISARAAMEKDLRHALEQEQFLLYFQSQVYHNGKIIGAEVLLRWLHPERGLVSPLDFISLAEDTGLILPIGQWVLDTACRQLKLWENHAGARHLQLAVNVSARQFHQTDFVKQVQQTITHHGINPVLLKLELTESLVLDNVDDTIAKMNRLKAIGVRFSMDDFGTGFSSLSYLTRLPLDQLKIDQSFVRNVEVKPRDSVIVQTIIGMAKNLGMEVIAEGVENEEQRAFLERHGCPTCQGYLFSKPVPIEQFETLLAE